MSFNIAIDGPAGAGKSTIAKNISKQLGFIYVDTGAMYRALALYFIRHQINADDEAAIAAALKQIDVTISYADGVQQVMLNGENITGLIRTQEVGNMASAVSVYASVREKLLQLQRNLADSQDVVMDGRDIGTFVLPKAQVKIYLTASAKERARRRWSELKENGIESDIDQIEEEIIERDNRDMTRAIAPLKQAQDAVLVDCSEMGIDEVVAAILKIYEERK